MPQPLPTSRDLLLRLLDHIDDVYAVMSRLADFLEKKIKEESDLCRAYENLPTDELVRRLSGWGIAQQDFAHRFLDLTDRMHERLEIVRPYLQAVPETPNTRWNEIVGMLGDGRSADEVLKLRLAMSEICVIYLEYLVELRHQVETVRRDVTNTVEGAPSPDEDREDGPTDTNTFRWKGKEATLGPKPFGLVKFLWKRRATNYGGQMVRRADMDDIAEVVWQEKGAGKRAIPSAMTQANQAFALREMPLNLTKKGTIIKLIISEQ